jgi:hypothetical protein
VPALSTGEGSIWAGYGLGGGCNESDRFVPEDLWKGVNARSAPISREEGDGAHLLEAGKLELNGAGDEGESVYGLKADFRPCVGEGMS